MRKILLSLSLIICIYANAQDSLIIRLNDNGFFKKEPLPVLWIFPIDRCIIDKNLCATANYKLKIIKSKPRKKIKK